MVLSKSTPRNHSIVIERRKKPDVLKDDKDGVERALRMLQHMINIDVVTQDAFHMVLEALVGRGRSRWNDGTCCVAHELPSLLDQYEQRYELTTEALNLFLGGFSFCASPRSKLGCGEQADDLFQRVSQKFNEHSYLHMVRVWAWQQENLDNSECADRADYFLQIMHQSSSDQSLIAQAQDWVLEAYSKAGGCSQQAKNIFSQRILISSVPVPIEDYTNIILSFAKDDAHEGSLDMAIHYLNDMTQQFLDGKLTSDPEHIAYNSVIAACARHNQPQVAEKILWIMEKEVRPHTTTLHPDVFTYNAVLHGYTKNNYRVDSHVCSRVEGILQYMEENYVQQPLIQPDSYSYNSLIRACVLSGKMDSGESMTDILDRMEAMMVANGRRVSNKNFNVVLNAYAKSARVEASLDLLDRMKMSPSVEPDIITYTTVIECISRCDDEHNSADLALQLLREVQNLHKISGYKWLMPNTRTFTMTILALARSNKPDKTKIARGLLDELIEIYGATGDPSLKPSEYTYNYVIQCAGNSLDDKITAFRIAALTYQEMRNSAHVNVDSFTYAFWLKACNLLLPPTDLYKKFVKLSFTQCRKEGMVTQEVLQRIKSGHLDQEELSDLLRLEPKETKLATVEDLRPGWSRNVRRR